MSTLDQDTLATMTDEERAAIEDDDGYTDEERAALKTIAGDALPDDDDDGDEEDDPGKSDPAKPDPVEPAKPDPAQAEPAKADPAPDPAKPADEPIKAAEPAARDTGKPTHTPRYDAPLPEDFDDRVKTIAEKERTLKAQFRDGELDFDAYEEQREALSKEREDLTVARVKSEISQEINTQSAAQQWQTHVNSFLDDSAKTGGIDYRADTAKAGDLDQFVKVLASNEANGDKTMDWFLIEADKRVKALHGIATPTATSTPPPAAAEPTKTPAQVVAEANAQRKPDLSAAPPTLANVPGGAGPGDVEGEFANLDSLDGEELEAAIGRLTPAQRERYAKA